ncbi:CE1759 family FMN reductase [Ornithinimicrobium cerasi]|uniref:FMN reductase n=1 Tax=Ornithinimicrobium cerasi TaxID=2248773 RepID=A0A285VUZ9_9MICO|nr:CE1759 family FMN reductase [Ornithinimicrobium cerasi]SOC57864.1 FMN reductase [Ornithinimicrobium cerasi]
MSRRIVVLTAGLSQPSSTRLLADQLADAVTTQVSARGESLAVDVIELRELASDLATTMTTGGMPTPAVRRALDLVSAADGLVAVTPVFAASYSGLFKMFVDVLDPDALTGMPVVIAATAGTARHQLVLDHALRPLFSYLRAVVLPTGVFAATEDFGGGQSVELSSRIARAAAELAAQVVAETGAVGGFVQDVAPARRRRSGTDVDTDVTDFETLLADLGQ